jgi:hypothetical protein
MLTDRRHPQVPAVDAAHKLKSAEGESPRFAANWHTDEWRCTSRLLTAKMIQEALETNCTGDCLAHTFL